MVRVVVVGIDGLDADLLRVYGPSLPNLRLLMLESPYLELQSCFPPDPASSWASIYTGRTPARHGMLSISSLEESAEQPILSTPSLPEGETFWEKASRSGKRVCVVNPLFPYDESSLNGTLQSFPAWEGREYRIGKKRHLGRLCQSLHAMTEQITATGLELLQREPWDIFFIQFSALDTVQHLLWRYSDPGDPAYPGKNEHSSRIRDGYALFDSIIGRFRAVMGNDCVLLVVSGYGHGRGCLSSLNLNEWLRSEGLLKLRHTRSLLPRLWHKHALNGRGRQHNIALLTHHNTTAFADEYSMLHGIAGQIDQQTTVAQVVPMLHSPTSGGIVLNRAAIEGTRRAETPGDYEYVRTSIIQRLLHLRQYGRPVVHIAKRREDIYQGEHIERFPDILFELHSEYGVSPALHVPLTTHYPLRATISGTHRMQGVLLLGNLPSMMRIAETDREPTVMDVAPTILSLTGELVTGSDSDGQTLLQVGKSVSLTQRTL